MEKAPIVIDGANVAYAAGGQFQVRDILLAVAYFQRLKHKVTVILPPIYRLKCEENEDEVGRVLRELQSDNILSFSPSGSNDDDFIIQRAVKTGSFILSCDKFEVEKQKHPEWKQYVENNRLNFTFVNGDDFTPNPTPLGPNGPTLKQFLSRCPSPLRGEVNVLDAITKSNQQLLNEILRISRRHALENAIGVSGAGRSKSEGTNSKGGIRESNFESKNRFELLAGKEQEAEQQDKKDVVEEAPLVVKESTEKPPADHPQVADQPQAAIEPTPESPQQESATESKPEAQSLCVPVDAKAEPKIDCPKPPRSVGFTMDDNDESPFQHVVTGCGTVIEVDKDFKDGRIRVDEIYSTNSCKFVEFYAFSCLHSFLETKLLKDEVTAALVKAEELMSRYPVGAEVGFVAAFMHGFGGKDNQTANALQVCAKSELLDGLGHCDEGCISADHAFLTTKSGQLCWSPCGDESLLMFRSAFAPASNDNRLDKSLSHHDWLEYKTMPRPVLVIHDAAPIVVKANYLRLTGLIVRLTKEHGTIRSSRINDFITFKNGGALVEEKQPSDLNNANCREKTRRQLKLGDWVQFRIRRQESASKDGKTALYWKAINVQLTDKPSSLCCDAELVDPDAPIGGQKTKKKPSGGGQAIKITAYGYVGALKPRQGVLWCQAIGRVGIDPEVLIQIDNLAQFSPGTLVKFEAIHRPNDRNHERKDTVWYATTFRKPTKNEQTQLKDDHPRFADVSRGIFRDEKATVDQFDAERRWAGLHARDSRYVLYDRIFDLMGRENGTVKVGEMVKVTYVEPPIDSPLYIAIAVEVEGS